MMQKAILIFLGFLLIGVVSTQKSYAGSQAACAIWLCLPAGFPGAECSPAHSEFKRRIKKGKPPLPNLAGCSKGPNGGYSTGRYEMGYEQFEPCKNGYILKTGRQSGYFGRRNQLGVCYASRCANRISTALENDYRCKNYLATPRPKPNFVKMWVDGQYLGQFFYN